MRGRSLRTRAPVPRLRRKSNLQHPDRTLAVNGSLHPFLSPCMCLMHNSFSASDVGHAMFFFGDMIWRFFPRPGFFIRLGLARDYLPLFFLYFPPIFLVPPPIFALLLLYFPFTFVLPLLSSSPSSIYLPFHLFPTFLSPFDSFFPTFDPSPIYPSLPL